ncbi:MAG TPA: MFS transporter [Thermoleophilaceae bacterium]|nr:MFS transporter [Thermoleophilaceae bacterium]
MNPTPTSIRIRPRLGARSSFAVVASLIGLALFASSTPSPMYGLYQQEWHFSTPVLTLVYAVYAFGVLGALLLVGRVSDDVGRRPVLAVSLGGLFGAGILFALAHSVGWLFAARALQGVTTGAVLGAAGAALLDLHPRGDGAHAGLINGVASAGGLGLGALVASVLSQYVADPLVVPFLVLLGLIAVAFALTLALPEPVAQRTRPSLRPQRPHVPATARRAFLLAGLGVLSSWSIGGLYLALGPTLVSELLHSTNRMAGGAAVLALTIPASLSQLVWNKLEPRRAAAVGSATLGVGMALTLASLSTGSAVLFLIPTAITGAGFGLAFLGALRSLTAAIPERQRAEVMSAFYIVAYLSLSLPAVGAGLAVPALGLEPTFRIFSAAVVVLALGLSVTLARTPSAERSGSGGRARFLPPSPIRARAGSARAAEPPPRS